MTFSSTQQVLEMLENNSLSQRLAEIYSCHPEDTALFRDRYTKCLKFFTETFGTRENVSLFSAPGRTEIGGNHTDHQHGRVLAGSVNLDIIAVAAPNNSRQIRIQSEGYPMDVIDLDQLEVHKSETGRAAALIRGIAQKLTEMGCRLGGLDAYTISNVPKGSGLSSSAAFEVMVGTILNGLYCEQKIDSVEIAKIGQYAENVYFGKPCGLMDQMACSVGGIIGIDFNDPSAPALEQINFDFTSSGHALCIIEAGGDHADLTDEYAAVPSEMKKVAAFFGKEFLRQVDEAEFYGKLASVRTSVGDRGILRAMHFFADNRRVGKQIQALRENDFDAFLQLVLESGRSSYMYLQNVFAASQPQQQGVSVALALCDRFLNGQGAFRVHGGGFAGTVQAFVPYDMLNEFRTKMESAIGKGRCHVLYIRKHGGIML